MRACWAALGGLALVGVFFTQACQSSLKGGPSGTGGAAATGAAGTTGFGGITQDTGSAGTGGIGGSRSGDTGSAGTGGTGGLGGGCVPPGGFGGMPVPRCGPAPICDGNSIATLAYCDQTSCSGPSAIAKRTPCDDGITCGGGKCLTSVASPVKACSIATDCGLPATLCVGTTEQLIFSDPSCDDGQCHWKQIVDTCGGSGGVAFLCAAGTCYDPGMQTRGPITPTPTPDAMQPPPAPDHACSVTTDCPQPPPSCFRDWVASYVHGVCRSGMCSWEINLDQCAGTCSAGACVAP